MLKGQAMNAYESWRPHLEKRITELEFFLDHVKTDLSMCNVSRDQATIFLDEVIKEMRTSIENEKVEALKRKTSNFRRKKSVS